jgi:tetratricopeptide (TPR) repeat protein
MDDMRGDAEGLAAGNHVQEADRAKAKGDRKSEIEHMRAAVASLGDASRLMQFGERLLQLNELALAEKCFRKVLKSGGFIGECAHGLGRVFKQRGDTTEAAAFFALAVDLDPGNVWRRLDLANALREIGQAAASEGQCLLLLRDHPSFGFGHFALGKARGLLGKEDEALESFRQAVKLQPDAPWLALELATHLRGRALIVEAEAAYRASLAANAEFAPGHVGLAKILEESSRGDEALRHFRAATEIEPGNAWYRLEVARLLQSLGRRDEAITTYLELTTTHPDFFHAYLALASLAREDGRFEMALEAYRKAATFKDANPWAFLEHGDFLRQLGRTAEAIDVFHQSIDRFPNFVHARLRLGAINCESGDFEQAMDYFRQVFVQEPSDVRPLKQIVSQLLGLNRIAEAESLCSDFIALNPGSAAGLLGFAEVARRRESRATVSELIAEAARLEPENPDVLLALAGDLSGAGKPAEAERIYDRVLRKDTDNIWALLGKARNGGRDQALDLLRRASMKHPRNEWAAIELSSELTEAGDFDAAHDVLAPFLGASFAAIMRAGQNARLAGRFSDARTLFTTLIDCHSSRADGYVELAIEEIRNGHQEHAVALLKQAQKLEPGNPTPFLKLGEIAQWRGDLLRAERLFRRAVAINPKYLWSALTLARCVAARGDIEAAMDMFDRIDAEIAPLAATQLAKFSILLQNGDYSGASRTIEVAEKNFPDDFEIWLQKRMFQIKMGEFEAAGMALSSVGEFGRIEKARITAARGVLSMTLWDIDQAEHWYAEARSNGANEPWIASQAALAALFRLNMDTAACHLRDYLQLNIAERSQRQNANISQTHIGQLRDEGRLDLQALAKLRSANATGKLAEIAAVVQDHPDYTTAAIHFLIALRRNGLFRSCADLMPEAGESSIPAEIVQFWDQQTPPADIAKMNEEWRLRHPTFSYQRFNTSSAQAFLMQFETREAALAFDRCTQPAQKSDLFRLAYLFDRGGVYVDADDRCRRNLTALLPPGVDLILYQEEFGSAGNNFIAVKKAHPVIEMALQHAIAAILRGDNDIVWLSTGPGLMTRAFATWLTADALQIEQRLERTLLLERHELYRFVAPHCESLYKHSIQHWRNRSFATRATNERFENAIDEII